MSDDSCCVVHQPGRLFLCAPRDLRILPSKRSHIDGTIHLIFPKEADGWVVTILDIDS